MNDPNRLTQRQIRFNADSHVAWDSMGNHRDRITSLITSRAGTDRLGVLGAGNCNDLNLSELLNRFAEIHLFDIDGQAMKQGLAKQQVADCSTIVRHEDSELTGVWDRLSAHSPEQPASEAEVDALIQIAQRGCNPLAQSPFDFVASTCLLSQLTASVVCTIGETHLKFLDVLRSIRHRHLQLLAESIVPGGTGLLVTDVVSSTAAPELQTVTQAELPNLLTRLIQSRNFFHGLNPGVLADLLENDPLISPLIASMEFLEPWIWDFGVRKYAVVAIRFQRSSRQVFNDSIAND